MYFHRRPNDGVDFIFENQICFVEFHRLPPTELLTKPHKGGTKRLIKRFRVVLRTAFQLTNLFYSRFPRQPKLINKIFVPQRAGLVDEFTLWPALHPAPSPSHPYRLWLQSAAAPF